MISDYQISVERIGSIPHMLNRGLCILFVLRGTTTVTVNQDQYHLAQQHIIIIHDYDMYSVSALVSDAIILRLQLSHHFLQSSCPELFHVRFSPASSFSGGNQASLIAQITCKIAIQEIKKAPNYRLKCLSLIFDLLHLLLSDCKVDNSKATVSNDNSNQLSDILSYLNTHFRERLQLREVAKNFFLSPSYLSRIIKQRTGLTFLEYLTQLRLDDAREKLVETRDSIAVIAIESGFPNERSFAHQFFLRYSQSPAEYRQKRTGTGRKPPHEIERLDEETLDALAIFLDHTSQQAVTQPDELVYKIDIRRTTLMKGLTNVLNIGHLGSALRTDVHNQILLAQSVLNLTYIRFELPPTPNSFIGQYFSPELDYYQILDDLKNLELIPMIQFPLDSFVFNGAVDSSRLETHLSLLHRVKSSFEPEYSRKWVIEISGADTVSQQLTIQICRALLKMVPGQAIGLNLTEQQQSRWSELLNWVAAEIPISFVTLTGDPNLHKSKLLASSYTSFFPNYFSHLLQHVNEVLSQAAIAEIPVYMIDWNTLTGSSTAEAGEFHRTALIAHAIQSITPYVKGIGLPLNPFSVPCVSSDCIETYPLSLFYRHQIQRHLFFVACNLLTQDQQEIFSDKHIICRREKDGKVMLMLYNPCYFPPSQAMENLISGQDDLEFCVQITGLEPGNYRIKRYRMDRNHGSLYHIWLQTGGQKSFYEDMIRHMSRSAEPEESIRTQMVQQTLTIQTKLSTNAVEVHQIFRMH